LVGAKKCNLALVGLQERKDIGNLGLRSLSEGFRAPRKETGNSGLRSPSEGFRASVVNDSPPIFWREHKKCNLALEGLQKRKNTGNSGLRSLLEGFRARIVNYGSPMFWFEHEIWARFPSVEFEHGLALEDFQAWNLNMECVGTWRLRFEKPLALKDFEHRSWTIARQHFSSSTGT